MCLADLNRGKRKNTMAAATTTRKRMKRKNSFFMDLPLVFILSSKNIVDKLFKIKIKRVNRTLYGVLRTIVGNVR